MRRRERSIKLSSQLQILLYYIEKPKDLKSDNHVYKVKTVEDIKKVIKKYKTFDNKKDIMKLYVTKENLGNFNDEIPKFIEIVDII